MPQLAPYTVEQFFADVRHRLGDTTKSIPTGSLISFTNTALRRMPRQRGLEKLYERKDTWELAYLNEDGTPSASWDLGNIGQIIDVTNLRVLKTVNGEVCQIKPRFMPYNEFTDQFVLPEQNTPGDPKYYTYEQLGSVTRLLFNRPPDDLIVLDIKYNAYFPRITSIKDEIMLSYDYADLLEEFVIILQKEEATDFSQARAMWENYDLMTAETVELLARNNTATGYRRMARSW